MLTNARFSHLLVTVSALLAFRADCGDFLVPKSEFRKTIRTIEITPVQDSLMASVKRLIDEAERGRIKQIDGSYSRPESVSEADIRRRKERINGVILNLKLNDETARMDGCRKIQKYISEYCSTKDKYQWRNAVGEDSASEASDGYLRTFLWLKDTASIVEGAKREGSLLIPYVAFITTYVVMIDASVIASSNAILWHKQEALFMLEDHKTIEDHLTEKVLREAVKKTFKSL